MASNKKCSPGCMCLGCEPITWNPHPELGKANMIALTQFVVVRRDIPDLRKIIDVGHATGEAFYKFSMLKLAPEGFDPDRTTLLVKGARNEKKLLKLEKYLISKGVYHVAIREPMAPWNGELMAIGLVPGDRESMSYHLSNFDMLKLTE